jgi:hypothetical protein
MILEMVVWGFFSAWGWIGANYIKDQVWPEKPAAVVQPQNSPKDTVSK